MEIQRVEQVCLNRMSTKRKKPPKRRLNLTSYLCNCSRVHRIYRIRVLRKLLLTLRSTCIRTKDSVLLICQTLLLLAFISLKQLRTKSLDGDGSVNRVVISVHIDINYPKDTLSFPRKIETSRRKRENLKLLITKPSRRRSKRREPHSRVMILLQ